jgi:hypothetical protein
VRVCMAIKHPSKLCPISFLLLFIQRSLPIIGKGYLHVFLIRKMGMSANGELSVHSRFPAFILRFPSVRTSLPSSFPDVSPSQISLPVSHADDFCPQE